MSRQGKEALRWHLRRLNLPPEEWADEVRDLNAQLVEALEQLRARELELDEHEELITRPVLEWSMKQLKRHLNQTTAGAVLSVNCLF